MVAAYTNEQAGLNVLRNYVNPMVAAAEGSRCDYAAPSDAAATYANWLPSPTGIEILASIDPDGYLPVDVPWDKLPLSGLAEANLTQ